MIEKSGKAKSSFSATEKTNAACSSFLPFYTYPDVFRSNGYSHMVSVIPYVVGIDKHILIPVRPDGQVIMVSFIKNEFHFSRQCSVFGIVLQVNLVEIHFHLHFAQRHLLQIDWSTFKCTTKELHMRFIQQFSIESVAQAFLFII